MAARGSLYYALQWAARGFKVFPLLPGQKVPRDKQFYLSATDQAAEVEKLFRGSNNYNIGVSTEGYVVVDVDRKNGVDGFAAFMNLDLPINTLVVQTPTGGYHYYYRAAPTSNTAGMLGLGVDTRGYHGYVVAPGSSTKQGVYMLSNDVPVVDAPKWLVQRLGEPRARKQQGHADVAPDDLTASQGCQQYLVDRAGAVEDNAGNKHTYDTACRCRDFGVSELTAYSLMSEHWNDKCSPPWSEEELQKIVGNAFEYGQNRPGILHPSVDFAGVKPLPVERVGRPWLRHGEAWEEDHSWLFYQMLPPAGVAVLTGLPNSGKSFMAVFLAEKLAMGAPFFGEAPDEQGGTIIIAAEGFFSFGRRLSVLGERPDKQTFDLPVSVTPASNLGDAECWKLLRVDLAAECKRMLDEFDVPVRMIVIDTLSAAGLIADENDNSMCARAMKKLADLAAEFDCLVLLLHHPPKTGEGLRGGSALLGSADYVLAIKPIEGKKAKQLVLDKARDAEAPRALGGFILQQRVTGEDRRGRPITTGYVESSEHAIFKSLAPLYQKEFMDAISWTRSDVAGLSVGDPVPLDALMKAFADRAPKSTRKQFYACQVYAISENQIEVIGPVGEELVHEIGGTI